MDFSSFFSFFKKKSCIIENSESIVIGNFKEVCSSNGMFVYENLTLYHHAQSFFIPLLILDSTRGIYLIEQKNWSYDVIARGRLSQAKHQNSSINTIAFDNAHEFIRKKFNELTHHDGVPLFHFLIMENLSAQEYERLDAAFQKLLPKQSVIFNDSSNKEIIQKLHLVAGATSSLPNFTTIMGSLLVQYLVMSNDQVKNLATAEQRDFIDAPSTKYQTLHAKAGSGKTTALLLKVILEKLKNPKIRIMVLAPTTIACDMLKQKIVSMVEYAMVYVDVSSIEIITPQQLLHRHRTKIGKIPPLEETFFIEDALLRTSYNCAQLLVCDDADLLPEAFIYYLRHLQKTAHLLLVSNKYDAMGDYVFHKSFRKTGQKFVFNEAYSHAKALQIISQLLDKSAHERILVVSHEVSREKLKDDLEFFIKDNAVLLDSSEHLVHQSMENLLLLRYEDLSDLHAKFVILLDSDSASKEALDYALGLSEETCYILYDQECENINYLRNKYENK